MSWGVTDSVAPGVGEGAAEAGASPAVIPTTAATIAAPPIRDAIVLRVFIFRFSFSRKPVRAG
jgi:hypothetical protein